MPPLSVRLSPSLSLSPPPLSTSLSINPSPLSIARICYTCRVARTPPSQLFESDELVLQSDGTLQKQFRVVGTNKVGMLAWHVMMRTPEYPEGREIVVIANDVTFQSGSFGVAEVCTVM